MMRPHNIKDGKWGKTFFSFNIQSNLELTKLIYYDTFWNLMRQILYYTQKYTQRRIDWYRGSYFRTGEAELSLHTVDLLLREDTFKLAKH